jgi:ABC-type multidrug transport system fused ATPase/permease subunit
LRTLLRYLDDHRGLWPVWLPLLVLSVLLPTVGLAMPLLERQFVDGVVLAKRLDALPQVGLLYCALWLFNALGGAVAAVTGSYLNERIVLRLRLRLFSHCEALSVAFARREHSGRTMSLFVSDAPGTAGLFGVAVVSPLGSVVALLISVAFIFSMSWQLALAAGVALPLVAGAAALVTRPLRAAARRVQEKTADLTERVQENLAGLREMVAFGRGRTLGRRLEGTQRELLRLRLRLTLMDAGMYTGQSMFSLAITLVVLGYGGYLVIQDQTTLGTLVAMRSLLGILFGTTGQLFTRVAGVQKALAAADRVYAFLDERPRVQERPGARNPDPVAGAVELDRVGFAYQPGRLVLEDISLTVRPVETVALVGPSGAGKTTLVSLIARFYDPTSGQVRLDGVDLRDLTLAGLRAQVGIVFQDSFLFASSIRENIAFGREGACEDEIVTAARAANAWEFIERLPHGLDTPVGERAMQLSEGQKQRLAIARAFLRNPRILILDEPTAALDARSEQMVQTALVQLMRGRTTFVIAHRLATVQRADQILVLDQGRIVERGTDAELRARDGLYRELFDLQLGNPARRAEAASALTDGMFARA